MFGWVVIVGLIGSAVLGWRWIVRLNRAITGREVVAKRLGLQVLRDDGALLTPPDLKGTINSQEVWVRHERSDRAGLRRRVKTLVYAPRVCLPTSLQVRGRKGIRLLDGWTRLISGDTITSHDPLFDQVADTRGSPTYAAALLTERARALISSALTEHPLEITEGSVRIERPGVVEDAHMLESMIHTVADIAAALVLGSALWVRLADNALHDPCAPVRFHNLDLLIQQVSGSAAPGADLCALTAARAALRDPDMSIRLRAALFLGAEAHDALSDMVASASAPLEVRVEAFKALAFRAPADVLKPLIRAVLAPALTQTEHSLLIEAAAFAAARCQDRDAFPLLVDHLSRHGAQTDAAIARALGRLGDVPAQPVLLNLLTLTTDTAVRVAIAESLGFIADADAVRALQPLTQGLRLDSTLKQTALAAIDAIQSRAGGARSAGNLALVVDPQNVQQAGELSFSNAPNPSKNKARPGDSL
jgi:hypothetical protein